LCMVSSVQESQHAELCLFRYLRNVIIVLSGTIRILEPAIRPSKARTGVIYGLFWCAVFAHFYLWSRACWPGLLARDER